jgi:hypothetical protein
MASREWANVVTALGRWYYSPALATSGVIASPIRETLY